MKTLFSFVLLFAFALAAPASLAQDSAAYGNETQDLLSTLEAQGNFTTLVSALRDTGLDEALASGETFTIFAPTDEAFQQLPAGTLEGLSPEQLVEVLRYHILVGAVPSQDAVALDAAPTVQGGELDLTTADGQLMVNDATVTEADIQASNGVIHVIDAVLMPEAEMDESAMDGDVMETDYDSEENDMTPAP
jgi:uncharacterized surface protein with fasciclin (FAS1) repeats